MRCCSLFLTLGVSLLVLGCAKEPSFDNHIVGEISYDGKPIKDGNITFTAKNGKGTPSSCTIKGGMFSLEAPPGDYSVDIESAELRAFGGKKNMDVNVPNDETKSKRKVNLQLKSK
jgi:hypothetical protein